MRGLRPALSTFIFLLLITGGVYPLLTTALGQWWFPWQANGSLIREGDTVRGSALIGQNFTDYSAAIFLIPICISFDTAKKRRYATYLILNRRFSFEF